MRKLFHVALPSAVLVLSACSETQPVSVAPTLPASGLEVLHQVSIGPQALVITVTSTGCTRKEHFDFVPSAADPSQLSVVRNQFDGCRRLPRPVTFEYAFADLGQNPPLSIVNPVQEFVGLRSK